MTFGVNFNLYNYSLYNYAGIKKSTDTSEHNCKPVKETYTVWKFDEEGNIVYCTYDKKTGELISKIKYKNPYKDFMKTQFNK